MFLVNPVQAKAAAGWEENMEGANKHVSEWECWRASESPVRRERHIDSYWRVHTRGPYHCWTQQANSRGHGQQSSKLNYCLSLKKNATFHIIMHPEKLNFSFYFVVILKSFLSHDFCSCIFLDDSWFWWMRNFTRWHYLSRNGCKNIIHDIEIFLSLLF